VQAPAYGHGKKGREGINGVGKVRRGYIVKFPHPMYFSLRWAEERWPCAYATLFSPTKGKIHGVWKFNNITPSHLSHPVDTFSALPSMTKRQFGIVIKSGMPVFSLKSRFFSCIYDSEIFNIFFSKYICKL
jgi:hypothetical protein